jgi:hypothetical protein
LVKFYPIFPQKIFLEFPTYTDSRNTLHWGTFIEGKKLEKKFNGKNDPYAVYAMVDID